MINLETILFKPLTKNNQPVVEDKLYITDIDDCWVKWYISKLLFRPVLLKENSLEVLILCLLSHEITDWLISSLLNTL